MSDIKDLFNRYAILYDTLESIKAELPQLAETEKQLEAIKKQIQEAAKEPGADLRDFSGSGFECVLSTRESWDTKKLPGFAVAHPELLQLRTETIVATVRKTK